MTLRSTPELPCTVCGAPTALDCPEQTFTLKRCLYVIDLQARLSDTAHAESASRCVVVPMDRLGEALTYALRTHLCYSSVRSDDKAIKDVMLPRLVEALKRESERPRK